MRWMILTALVVCIIGCKPSIYLQSSSVKLSKPAIQAEEIFFEDQTIIPIGSTADKAEIWFLKSNEEWQKYKAPITIDQSTKITAEARGGGFISSDPVSIEVLKCQKMKSFPSIHKGS